jgi:hypothetical protein
MSTNQVQTEEEVKPAALGTAANGRAGPAVETMIASSNDLLNDTTLDPEFDYYLAHLPEWYEREREHVLIHGSEHFGFFPNRNDALAEGFRRFGRVPFLVKRIERDEKPMSLGWLVF